MRTAVYDLGENPRGARSKRQAIARSLRQRGSDLKADSFDRVDEPSGREKANFILEKNSFELVRLYLQRLDRGWLVIAYAYCKGEL